MQSRPFPAGGAWQTKGRGGGGGGRGRGLWEMEIPGAAGSGSFQEAWRSEGPEHTVGFFLRHGERKLSRLQG